MHPALARRAGILFWNLVKDETVLGLVVTNRSIVGSAFTLGLPQFEQSLGPSRARIDQHEQARPLVFSQPESWPLVAFLLKRFLMNTCIGLDVCQEFLDLHIRPAGTTGRVPNTAAGHRDLLTRLPAPETVDRIVLEATGGLEAPVAAVLAAAGYPVAIVNPRQVRDFAKATGRLAKTDALDAAVLAHFAEAIRPAVRPQPSAELQEFREILDRRQQLLQMKTAEDNRLGSTRHQVVVADLEAHLAWLAQRLKDVDALLADRVATHLHWKADEKLLRSVPGIGAQTARMLIGHLPELGRLDRRELASLVGLAPVNHDSGSHRGLRHIVGGRAAIRKALYMAALASLTHNPTMAAYYHHLRARGKAGKTALIAVARKLLCITNAILRTRTPWQQPTPGIV